MSYFQIDRFMSEFQDGFQRINQFRCMINVSAVAGGALTRAYPRAASWLAQGILCEGTRTPSRSFETVALEMYGYQEKFPVFTTYTDLECSFLMPLAPGTDGVTNEVSQLLNEWQNLIQRRHTSGSGADDPMVLRFPSEYRVKQGFTLELLNPYNGKRSQGGIGVNVNAAVPYIPPLKILNKVFRNKNAPAESEYQSPPTQRYEFFNVYPITVESSTVGWQSINEVQRVTVAFAYSYWVS
mgnify:CR=1 FL=1|tara:strand:- start:4112 stop:4831 length:720 start_codon:yes stop_codon:yes gene_type:complete